MREQVGHRCGEAERWEVYCHRRLAGPVAYGGPAVRRGPIYRCISGRVQRCIAGGSDRTECKHAGAARFNCEVTGNGRKRAEDHVGAWPIAGNEEVPTRRCETCEIDDRRRRVVIDVDAAARRRK